MLGNSDSFQQLTMLYALDHPDVLWSWPQQWLVGLFSIKNQPSVRHVESNSYEHRLSLCVMCGIPGVGWAFATQLQSLALELAHSKP